MSIPILTIGGAGFISSRFADELMQDDNRTYTSDGWWNWICPADESGIWNNRSRTIGVIEPHCCFSHRVGDHDVHIT